MIQYNDIMYICHHLHTLGYDRQELPPHLKIMSCFIDEIPFFYQMAKEGLKKELDYHRTQILSIMKKSSGISGEGNDKYINLEGKINSILLHISYVAKSWRVNITLM